MSNFYFITTPFVDAYSRDTKPIKKDEFDRKMRCQAEDWGGQGLWYGLKKLGDVPKDILGRPVLAIGVLNNKSYAAVFSKSAEAVDCLEIVECGEWADGWDVT